LYSEGEAHVLASEHLTIGVLPVVEGVTHNPHPLAIQSPQELIDPQGGLVGAGVTVEGQVLTGASPLEQADSHFDSPPIEVAGEQ
jgi:hypothetical protein